MQEYTNHKHTDKHPSELKKAIINRLIAEYTEIAAKRKGYVEDLLKDNEEEVLNPDDINCPKYILNSEVKYAIIFAKVRKAVGSDEISAELIKAIEKTEVRLLNTLSDLFNKIYDVRQLSNNWLQSFSC